MLALGWLLAFLAAALIVMVLPAVAWFEVRRAYSGKRQVTCPETNHQVDVELDKSLAARSRFHGTPIARIASCSRWPMREGCAEGCVSEAVTKNKPDSFALNHFGIVVAGLASAAVGDLLRCSPVAREWMASGGYTTTEFWRRIAFRAPAVFDLVAMILVAYVITWLMRHVKLTGFTGGVEVAALVWLAVICLSIPEVVFFFPVKIFAMTALLKLVTLLVQGMVLGLLVVPHPSASSEAARA